MMSHPDRISAAKTWLKCPGNRPVAMNNPAKGSSNQDESRDGAGSQRVG